MVLEIVKYGHPALRQKGAVVKEVDDKIRQLAIDMLETMEAANGVGLAAQQVGVPIQLAVIDVADIEDRPSTMHIAGKPVGIEAQIDRKSVV
jgi:peptide deformylase